MKSRFVYRGVAFDPAIAQSYASRESNSLTRQFLGNHYFSRRNVFHRAAPVTMHWLCREYQAAG
jgi:hypothetical protein